MQMLLYLLEFVVVNGSVFVLGGVSVRRRLAFLLARLALDLDAF